MNDASRSQYIWFEPSGEGRNLFAGFLRTLKVTDKVAAATLHLFADTRYRLSVNGQFVAAGPCRFFPERPHVDSIDLKPFLNPGENVILVEVNQRGEKNYQSVHSRGGFIAWGTVEEEGGKEHYLCTPGKWQARQLTSRVQAAPTFSFAQAATEIIDLQSWSEETAPLAEGWMEPVLCEPQEHWGTPEARPVPAPSYEELKAKAFTFRGSNLGREERILFHRQWPVVRDRRDKTQEEVRFGIAICLHSPKDQVVNLGLHWGPFYLNGKEIAPVDNPLLGSRQDYPASLQAGWNVLYGEPAALTTSWGLQLAIPNDKGLKLASLPDAEKIEFLVSEGYPASQMSATRGGEIPASVEDLQALVKNGVLSPASDFEMTDFPAREVAWDEPGENLQNDPTPHLPVEIPVGPSGEGTLVIDFGREWIGFAEVRIEAPEGTVLDISNDELLRSDGFLRMYHSNPFVNNTDRFTLPGGSTHLQSFHERGGRYLQLSVRLKEAKGPVTLHAVGIRSFLAPLPEEGYLETGDPLMNWAWKAGIATQQASLTDAWVDPWREQGAYMGDTYVEFHATRAFNKDLSFGRHLLRLWGQSVTAEGRIQSAVPSTGLGGHGDFALIFVLMLRDYWALSGDSQLIEELWPAVKRIVRSPLNDVGTHGLWNAGDRHVFIDWGAHPQSKQGEANLGFNAFRVGVLKACSEMTHVLTREAESAAFAKEAEEISQAINETLWNGETGLYAAKLEEGKHSSLPALHGNLLCLLYDIVPEDKIEGLCDRVIEGMWSFYHRDGEVQQGQGQVDLYFLFYGIEALSKHGRFGEAEEFIRSRWGLQERYGALTVWESYVRGAVGTGSQCHGWAAAPNVYLVRTVLGIKHPQPGQPSLLLIQPEAISLGWARGSYPMKEGLVEVDWKVVGESFLLDVNLPKGVEAEVKPGASFAHLKPNINVTQA